MLTSVGSTIGTIVGFGYFGVCALAFTFQRKLQYFPTKEPPPLVSALPPVCRGIEGAPCAPRTARPCKRGTGPPFRAPSTRITLLQLHGNAGSRHNRLYWAHHMRTRLGVGVALLDYRGYGGSTGRITEAGMIMDGVAGITWAATKAAESGSKLVLHLESIGSAAGVAAAARLSPDSGVSGIVVEGGLSSCVELAKNIFSFIPVGLLMKDKWAGTCAAAAALEPDVPFMSMHGDGARSFRSGAAGNSSTPFAASRCGGSSSGADTTISSRSTGISSRSTSFTPSTCHDAGTDGSAARILFPSRPRATRVASSL